jgi:hypothetical protein
MKVRDSELFGVACGAIFYFVASFLRSAIYDVVGTRGIGSWFQAIDASFVYAIALGAGFVATRVFSKGRMRTGIYASAMGEFARSLLKLVVAVNATSWMSFPPHLGLSLFLGIIPAGILGFAGAAIALVARLPNRIGAPR